MDLESEPLASRRCNQANQNRVIEVGEICSGEETERPEMPIVAQWSEHHKGSQWTEEGEHHSDVHRPIQGQGDKTSFVQANLMSVTITDK